MVTQQIWREERVTVELPDGSHFCVPVGWTDILPPDPYLAMGGGRSLFRVEDLLALADQVEGLMER